MSDIYSILCMTVGVPPARDEKLSYEYYDKDKKFKSFKLSPKEIYKSLAPEFVASESISLINDPRNHHSKLYTVERLGNVWEGRPVLYVNTDTDALERTVVKMLKANMPVWFGCDVGKDSSTALGIMGEEIDHSPLRPLRSSYQTLTYTTTRPPLAFDGACLRPRDWNQAKRQ